MSAVFFMLAYLFIKYLLFYLMLPETNLNGNQEKGIISSALLNKEEIF